MRTTRSIVIVALAGIGIALGSGCSHHESAPGGSGGNGDTGGGAGGGGVAGGGSGGGGGAGGGGAGGVGGGGGGGSGGGGTVAGCSGQSLLALPSDPSARGPWPVGARTVTLAGLTVEVWYPATPGSDAGQMPAVYDIREHLPAADAAKIPDADNPWQSCDCVRALPLDDGHGPYPLVLFVHGTAAFRTQSLTFMTHWASRGFVVVAADHPGIQLKDVLASPLGLPGASDQAGDANKILDALAAPSGDIAFLAGHLDGARIAASGHSAGGGAIAGLGGRAAVLIPMASMGTQTGATLGVVARHGRGQGRHRRATRTCRAATLRRPSRSGSSGSAATRAISRSPTCAPSAPTRAASCRSRKTTACRCRRSSRSSRATAA